MDFLEGLNGFQTTVPPPAVGDPAHVWILFTHFHTNKSIKSINKTFELLLNPFVSFILKLVLFYHFYIFTLNIIDSFYWSGTNSGSSRFIKIQKTKCNSKFLPLLLNNGHHRCRNNLCVTKYSKLTQSLSILFSSCQTC